MGKKKVARESNNKATSISVKAERLFSVTFTDIDGDEHHVMLDDSEAAALRNAIDEALNTTGPS